MHTKENKFHLQPYLIEMIHFDVFASSLFLTRCFCVKHISPTEVHRTYMHSLRNIKYVGAHHPVEELEHCQ